MVDKFQKDKIECVLVLGRSCNSSSKIAFFPFIDHDPVLSQDPPLHANESILIMDRTTFPGDPFADDHRTDAPNTSGNTPSTSGNTPSTTRNEGSALSTDAQEPQQGRRSQFAGSAFVGGFGEYMTEKIRKLDVQFRMEHATSDGQLPRIFAGVTIYVDGYTRPPMDELRTLIGKHGGTFSHYFRPATVTHIIAEALSHSKQKEWRNARVVRPTWIVDSIAAGKLLPWQSYRLLQVGSNTAMMRSLVSMDRNVVQGKSAHSVQPVSEPLRADDHSPPHVGTTRAPRRPWTREQTTMAPGFVAKYFRASRLHHISSWKNELRPYSFAKRDNEGTNSTHRPRIIMHIDMDCFFASVALRDRPKELSEKPVAVAHGQGSGGESSEIASCNYVARENGVKNGMFVGRAKQLCPELVILPYEFDKYKEASHALYEILSPLADSLQAASCDEALMDVSSYASIDEASINRKLTLNPEDDKLPAPARVTSIPATTLAMRIHSEVYRRTRLSASIGIGENILLARIATRRAKPGGVFHMSVSDENDLFQALDPLAVDQLPGIGWSIREKLEDHPTCGAVRRHFTRTADLQAVLGAKLGERVWQMVRGIDTRPVFSATTNESTGSPPSLKTSPTTTTVGGTGNTRKSIGAEVNWGVRFETEDQFRRFMVELVDEVVERLRDPSGFPAGVMIPATGSHTPTWRTRAVTVKLRLRHPEAPVEPEKYLGCGWCNSYSHTVQLFQDVDDAPALVDAALGAFGELRRRLGAMFAFEDVRGCGVMCGKLMFDDGTVARQPSQKRIGELLEMQKERTNKRHAVNDGTSADVSFVNPSQVDTSVLDELPADIQQEIRRGMLKRHSSRNTTIIPSTPPAKQRNLRQHTATPSPRMASTRTLDDYFSPSKELRSPFRMNDGTVVDPATWASLPEEIRRELAEEARRIRPMRARSGVKSEALRHDEDGRDFRSKLIILPRETAAFPLMTMDMAEIQQQIHTWLNSDEGDIDDLEEDLVSLQENLLDLVDHLQYDRVDAVLRIMQREAMGVGEHDHVTQSVLKLAQVIRKAMRDNAMGSG